MYQPQQQAPLTGAYYGPPIPPPQPEPMRSRSCFCCLLSTAIKIFIGVMVVLGIAALVLWLVLRPNNLKAYVTDASLTRFNLTAPGNNNLQYNLSTVVSIRNPNRRVGVYYDWLEANAYYDGERFSWVPLPTFYQGHKNTTTLFPVFAGQSVIDLGGSGVQDFNSHRQAGSFDVTLRLYGRIRFKIGSFKTKRYTMRIRCYLWLPLDNNDGRSGARFTGSKCDVDF